MTAPTFDSTLESPNLLVMEASGKMDALAMEIALDMLVREMAGMHHGGILMKARGISWPSLGAIGVELRHWGQMMAMIEKVDKIALLTDQAWVRSMATVESALIPNLVIKSFAPDQEAMARAWLAEPLRADATAG